MLGIPPVFIPENIKYKHMQKIVTFFLTYKVDWPQSLMTFFVVKLIYSLRFYKLYLEKFLAWTSLNLTIREDRIFIR